MSTMENRTNWLSVLRWVARVWSLPAIFFAISEFLFPGNENGIQEGFFTWLTVIVLFLSVIGLLIAWWKESLGGWVSLAALAVFFILYAIDAGEFFPGWGYVLPFIVAPAVLFLVYGYYQQKNLMG